MTALLTSRNLAAAPTEAAQLGTPGIAVLLLGAFLPIVDFFIVNVALPTIDTTLHASAPSLELVVAGHGTVYAALLVVGGRLDDALGRRRVFVAGLIGFTLTSLLCGLAPSIGALIAFRLAQAAAAALIVPQVLGTFQSALDGPRRARALGLYGATAGISAVVGQVVGGLLVTANIAGTEWRPIFLVNVPVGLFGLAVVFRHVPATRSDRPAGVDLLGTVLFAATLATLLIPLTEGRTVGWPLWTWLLLAAAPVLGAATYVVERRGERAGATPLLPPSLLRVRSMRRGLTLAFPFFLSFGGLMFVFALTVQDGLHADALRSGLAIAPFAVAFLIGSLLTPRAIERFGRAALGWGSIVQAVGLSVLAWTVTAGWPDVALIDMTPGLVIAGFGQAFVFGSLFRLILADVPPRLAGIGGGVLVTLQQAPSRSASRRWGRCTSGWTAAAAGSAGSWPSRSASRSSWPPAARVLPRLSTASVVAAEGLGRQRSAASSPRMWTAASSALEAYPAGPTSSATSSFSRSGGTPRSGATSRPARGSASVSAMSSADTSGTSSDSRRSSDSPSRSSRGVGASRRLCGSRSGGL
jgi:MFS family permease